jgi:hypothetical protein
MTTKKSLAKIAENISKVRHGHEFVRFQDAKNSLCHALGLALLDDNPNFDMVRFLTACGINLDEDK